jgi:myo-inositol-1(or 4)-monophosphatase
MLELCRTVAEDIEAAVAPFEGKGREDVIDAAAEEAGFKVLEDSRISMLLVSEESGVTLLGDDPALICLLDPIDGTFNAAAGIPVYATSIAFARYREGAVLGDIEYAFVKNLFTGESYEAVRGKGAWKDGVSLKPSKKQLLEEGTFSVYLYGAQLPNLGPSLKKLNKIRTLGCASLELCLVATGVYEGMIDLRGCMRNIDIAAGKLIVEEAGGKVSGKRGEDLRVGLEDVNTLSLVVGGNDYIHRKLTRLLERK